MNKGFIYHITYYGFGFSVLLFRLFSIGFYKYDAGEGPFFSVQFELGCLEYTMRFLWKEKYSKEIENCQKGICILHHLLK